MILWAISGFWTPDYKKWLKGEPEYYCNIMQGRDGKENTLCFTEQGVTWNGVSTLGSTEKQSRYRIYRASEYGFINAQRQYRELKAAGVKGEKMSTATERHNSKLYSLNRNSFWYFGHDATECLYNGALDWSAKQNCVAEAVRLAKMYDVDLYHWGKLSEVYETHLGYRCPWIVENGGNMPNGCAEILEEQARERESW